VHLSLQRPELSQGASSNTFALNVTLPMWCRCGVHNLHGMPGAAAVNGVQASERCIAATSLTACKHKAASATSCHPDAGHGTVCAGIIGGLVAAFASLGQAEAKLSYSHGTQFGFEASSTSLQCMVPMPAARHCCLGMRPHRHSQTLAMSARA
jgi:hypothetical protein